MGIVGMKIETQTKMRKKPPIEIELSNTKEEHAIK